MDVEVMGAGAEGGLPMVVLFFDVEAGAAPVDLIRGQAGAEDEMAAVVGEIRVKVVGALVNG